ncbi:NADH dehydrogenase 32K chain homolog [Halarchaeum acidiphilum MH1-52-1]|uniref:NADH dehydrogenase 32K chain homolog n=1 Tax=Halarchaeum acidiphilum MH1-52-1 TaxID=1261545 RepID=U2YVW1_9EURY|nr:complex I NDUFA9 subunit family protein [Halarchaeum acidiphilum]GAD52902.1 NADH dehydrogenase 32K chain homolog [Halarchaeum acidiphilum MH1-52-1]
MQVLVTGGTGFIGTHLCRELDARGHDVTALSRSPDGDGGDLPESVATAMGDVTAYDSIEGAFEGQDAVVNLVALSPLFEPKGGDETHFEVHLEGTRNVVRAAEERGVRKLVQLSALGADPEGETAYVRSKGQAERVVRASDLAWTIFRPSVVFGDGGEFVSFTETLTTPYVTALPGGGGTRFQPLWVGDLVGPLADSLDAAHDGETYEVGGPEVLTLADVATAVYRAKGRSLTVLSVPMALAKVGMSLADPLPFVPFGSDQYRSLRFDNTVPENDVTAFGRDPSGLTRLTEYLRERRGDA